MKKTLKITGITVVVLLAILIIVPMALRGKIGGIVKKEANEMLTAKLDFQKLDISLLRHFPHASVELKGLTLVGVDRFAGDTIVSAERISVVVNLMSLFGDSGYEVTKVILATPAVHAHKLADGAVNWNVMKPSDEKTKEEETASSFHFSIRDLRINDATIRYEDDSTHMTFVTRPASLRLKGDMTADRTLLALQLKAAGMRFVSGNIPWLSNADAQLDAKIDADLKNNHYAFSQNKFRLNSIVMNLDGWVELRDSIIAMDIKAGCDKVQFKDILSLIPAFYTRQFSSLSASGELGMNLWAKGEMKGSQLPAFELNTTVKNGSFQYSSLPKAVTDINIALKVSNPGSVIDKTEVNLSQLSLKMAGNSLSATLYATNLISDPLFRAAAHGKVNLGAIKEVYPLEKGMELNGQVTADVKVGARMSAIDQKRYEQISAAGTFVIESLGLKLNSLPKIFIRRAAATITPQAMTLGEFALTVGKSDISANGQLSGYIGYFLRKSMLTGRLYVKSDLLDLNEIMQSMPADTTTKAKSTEPMQAIVIPKNLDLTLSTELQKILFQKMTITGLSGGMRVTEGALLLEKLRMQLFDGKATASGSYSTAVDPKQPALKLDAAFTNASFVKTFNELEIVQKLVPIFSKTGGDYSMNLNMTSTLDSHMSPVLNSVNATGELKSSNIHLQNIAAFDALATALNNDEIRNFDAHDLVVKFTIRDGRVITQPFDLKLGGIHINLSGSTGLDQTIDYSAKVALPGGGVIQNIPVTIGGTYKSPKISLGVKDVAKEAAKNAINKEVQKLTGSESLSAEIDKQAQRLRDEAKAAGDKLVSEAQAQRDKLVEEAATKGALAKFAAEKAGDKAVAAAQKQATKLQSDAETKIQELQTKAQEKTN